METPRRRGRPPGSKNRVITDIAPALPAGSIAVTSNLPYTWPPEHVDLEKPASVESWTTGPRGGINVSIEFGRTMSKEGVIKTGYFPVGWPIPQLNDVVRLGGEVGRVKWVEYDYDQSIVRITAQ